MRVRFLACTVSSRGKKTGCLLFPQGHQTRLEGSTPTTWHTHNHLPKASPPHTITLAARASTYEFWRDTSIESMIIFFEQSENTRPWTRFGRLSFQLHFLPNNWRAKAICLGRTGHGPQETCGWAWRFQGEEHLAKKGLSLLPIFPAWKWMDTAATAKSLQSCPTLCDPIDGSPPGSPVPGIL